MDEQALYFDELNVGDVWKSKSHEISQGEIREFADLTGDHNPIHVDEDYAATTPFGEPIAHGMLGLSLMVGMGSECPKLKTMALLSLSDWQFTKPIFVGDQIHAVNQITGLKEHGRRHGQVEWLRQLVNQRGEVVQSGTMFTLVARSVAVKILKKQPAHPGVPAPIGNVVNPSPNTAPASSISSTVR